MKILVIGGGLIGLTSAYFLRRRGHEVTVIDRCEGPGRETSFANGALLTPSMSDPWNAPGCWRVLLASIFRSDSPLQLRLQALPALMTWGMQFLRNSSPAAYERNTLSNLRLSLYSLGVLASFREQIGIEYGRTARGGLKVFRDPLALDRTEAASQRLVPAGLRFRKLSTDETIALEPALAPMADVLAGSIHYEADETGDAYRFCVALAEEARKLGVEFRFQTAVTTLESKAGKITAVLSGSNRFVADGYVVAAGSYSAPLLGRIGVQLPVRPAKGYSITIDRPTDEKSPRIPIVDDALHAAVVPLENAIRVAGTAEFAGYDLTLAQPRIQNLLKLVRQVFPQMPFDPHAAKPWCGLRPMSADGVPIIGSTSLSNLFVNTGHGHLGWTMAAGSGQLLADLLTGDAPALDPAPYSLARF